jgi:putative protease
MLKKPELMAPAGDWTMLHAVVNNGANAVYFGIENLNMRVKAGNFSVHELPKITELCREHNVKSYLTVNIIVYENELPIVKETILKAKVAGIDAIICWDFAVIQICKETGMAFCVSTQASVSNSASAKFFKDLGAKRIVTARECSLKAIKEIKSKTDIEVEAFVHGAMCIAVSGRCFMSHHLFGKSANRGECIQPCRREFEVIDNITGKPMLLGEDYVLSPKDLCTIEFIDKLIEAGIDSFKIEGRKRSPEYAARAVSVYRKAIDLYFEGKLTQEIKKQFLSELEEVYNRGFSSGFYFHQPSSNEYSNIYGSRAVKQKVFIGKIINYYKAPKAAYLNIETGGLKLDDNILIIGSTTGVVELKVEKLMNEEDVIQEAGKGDKVTFPCGTLVRPRDAVYKVVNVEVEY